MSGSREGCTETTSSFFENSCDESQTRFLRNRQTSPPPAAAASSSNTRGTELSTQATTTDRMSPSATTARKAEDGNSDTTTTTTAAEEKNSMQCPALTSTVHITTEQESPVCALSHQRIYRQQLHGRFLSEQVGSLSGSTNFGSCTLPSLNVTRAVSMPSASRPTKPRQLSLCVEKHRSAEKELQTREMDVNPIQTFKGTEAGGGGGGKLSLLQQPASRCADHCPHRMTITKSSVENNNNNNNNINSAGCTSQTWPFIFSQTLCCGENCVLSRSCSSSLPVKSTPSPVTGCGACSAFSSSSGCCCSSRGVTSAALPGDASAAVCSGVSVSSAAAVSSSFWVTSPHAAHLPSPSPVESSGEDSSQRSSLSSPARLVPFPAVCSSLPGSACRGSSVEKWASDSIPSPVGDLAASPGISKSRCPCLEKGSSCRHHHQCSSSPHQLQSVPEDNHHTALLTTSSDILELPTRTPSSSSVESVDSGVWSPLPSPSPSPSTSTSISLFPVTLATLTTTTTSTTTPSSTSPQPSSPSPPSPPPSTTSTTPSSTSPQPSSPSPPSPPPPSSIQTPPTSTTTLRHNTTTTTNNNNNNKKQLQHRCQTDFERLGRSVRALQDACFYYPELDSDGAQELLQNAAPGTYLVRDSSDSRFLFAVTLKTERGPTSVRIAYRKGLFQMDCASHMQKVLPRFETMLELLDFHTAVCRQSQGAQYRWLETSARRDLLVHLTAPRRHSPPSLSHQARVTINRTMEDLHLPARSTDLLPLPASMKQFLRDYPYRV